MKTFRDRLTTGVASLAILANSFGVALPFVLAQKAAAATPVVVTESNLQGWTKYGTAQTEYVLDASAPGDGALRLSDTDTNYVMYYRDATTPTPIENINISYDSRRIAGDVHAAPAYVLGIDPDGNTGAAAEIYAYYEPVYNGGTNYDSWKTWTLDQTAKFYFKDGGNNPITFNGKSQYDGTLADVKIDLPNAMVIDYTINQGTGNAGWVTHVDNVVTPEAIYDFEPTPYIKTAPPTKPVVAGDVIFDSIPNTLPSNSVSTGYQATATRALGDKISFAGTGRNLLNGAVTLSSWACQSGTWNSGCTTTPGATFSHPVTLNIYNTGAGESVGSLVASRTQTFNIPYRPTADPTCGSATQWRDTNNNCFNGLNHVVVFDLTGITVPDSVIYSVEYNTQTYGPAPIGSDGPFSSLNVSLNTAAPTIGTNADADQAYWDSTYGGRVAGLATDSGWTTDGNPAVLFTAAANTAPVVTFAAPTPAEGSTVSGTITPHVLATDDYGMGSYFIRLWKGAFESGAANLVSNNCYSAPGAYMLGTAQDITCPSIDTTGLDDGTYVLSAQFQDGSIVWGQALRTFTVDNSGPNVNILQPLTGTIIRGNSGYVFRVEATDPAGVDKVDFQLRNGTGSPSGFSPRPMTRVGTSNIWEVVLDTDVASLPNGSYLARARAYDTLGNFAADSESNVKVDNSAPAIVITSPTSGEVLSGNTLNITGSVTDENSRYYYCYLTTDSTVTYNGTAYTPGQEVGVRNPDCVTKWSSTSVSGALGSIDLSGLPNGNYTINLVAYDTAGNNNAATPVSVSFALNNTITAPAVLSWVQNNGPALVCGSTTSNPLAAPTWSTVTGASYYLYSYRAPGGTWITDTTQYTSPTTGNTAFGTTEGIPGLWEFRVQAVTVNGDNVIASEWSEPCGVTFSQAGNTDVLGDSTDIPSNSSNDNQNLGSVLGLNTNGQVLAASTDGLTTTGSQINGIITLIAGTMLGLALLVIRRKQQV